MAPLSCHVSASLTRVDVRKHKTRQGGHRHGAASPLALASVAEGPEAEAEAGKGVGKGVGGVSGGGVKREKRGLKIFASTWNMGGGAFALMASLCVCMHACVCWAPLSLSTPPTHPHQHIYPPHTHNRLLTQHTTVSLPPKKYKL